MVHPCVCVCACVCQFSPVSVLCLVSLWPQQWCLSSSSSHPLVSNSNSCKSWKGKKPTWPCTIKPDQLQQYKHTIQPLRAKHVKFTHSSTLSASHVHSHTLSTHAPVLQSRGPASGLFAEASVLTELEKKEQDGEWEEACRGRRMECAHSHKGQKCAVIHKAAEDRDSVRELWLQGRKWMDTHTHTVCILLKHLNIWRERKTQSAAGKSSN